jgi:hypothetical protein
MVKPFQQLPARHLYCPLPPAKNKCKQAEADRIVINLQSDVILEESDNCTAK